MFTLETGSNRILDSKIKNAKVHAAIQELKTAVNSPAPGSSVTIQPVFPDRHELSVLSTQGITSVVVFIYGSTGLVPERIGLSSATSATFYLPQKPDGVKRFEESWKILEAPPAESFEKRTDVNSSPSLDRLDALKLALSAERFALLARIRAFRKKVGKLDFTVNELLREVREESA